MSADGEVSPDYDEAATPEAMPAGVEIIPASAEGQERVIVEAAHQELRARRYTQAASSASFIHQEERLKKQADIATGQVHRSIWVLEQLFPDKETTYWRDIINARADAIAAEIEAKRKLA